LSLLFGAIVATRRLLYRTDLLPSAKLPVPVIVVGNISVGGTGKTPLVLWLAQALRHKGYRPGIVTRGYGGSQKVQPVEPNSDARHSGDEALLLARNSGCAVWAGRDRVAAGKALLAAYPQCDVVISDDGLQHYRLRRDVELCVIDARRRFGNGLLLPAGPLRERLSRLRTVDAVVTNGDSETPSWSSNQFAMHLCGTRVINLQDRRRVVDARDLAGPVHAVAGIGNPQRFFDHLRKLGVDIRPHPFPDHHAFTGVDLAFAGEAAVLMTEKDAVKCEEFARENFWFLPVEAQVDPRLADHLVALLRASHGRQAA
jgi:tetraacyldisaccharide 4'-kinase